MPDIGKGLVVLGEREEALARAWHLPNPETVTTREFVHMIFEEAGEEPKMLRAPKPLLWTLGLFNPALRETIEMLYEFEEPFVVDHSAFARAFGDHATPLREAIRRTMRWHRDECLPGV
jgi:nucleoside-diphosphate-sugar epimerase